MSTDTGSADQHPNHYATVVAAKAELVARGISITGACGAFEIVKKVVQLLAPSEPQVGLLAKSTVGLTCLGYAVDTLCYNDGISFTILADPGGTNTEQWSFGGMVLVNRWRAPL